MDIDHWERVKELFAAVLELPEGDRAAFLRQACQDDSALRMEVESLLSGHAHAGSFLEKPARVVRPGETASVSGAVSDSAAKIAAPPAPAFAPDEIISGRFRVIRFIGRGGMGDVYEARDLELGERVALKTIRSENALAERGLARFKKEVLLARRVTHPNVCRIFDLERHQIASSEPDHPPTHVTFLTMELLDGETLADRLARVERMTTAEALPVIEQMAEALAAAHAVGVVHRDFKPGNVMLVRASSGSGAERAVVTDFGLAKAFSPASEASTETSTSSATSAGRIVGTAVYMAPEQLRGGEITAATDIYALGLVIYEMVTGRRPFANDAPLGVYQRLSQPPISPRTYLPELDPKWESTILRCLEIDPAARFGTARDVAAALTGTASKESPDFWARPRPLAWTAAGLLFCLVLLASIVGLRPDWTQAIKSRLFPPPIPQRKNLVVLPFTAVGGRPEEQVYCDGFTETVTTRLGQVPSVGVPPALEVRKERIESIKDARIRLGANLVLLGTWQRLGSAVRVNLALVDAQTLAQLRTRTVDGQMEDPLAFQNQVLMAVMSILEVRAPNSPMESAARVAAYDDYLLGRGYLQDYLKPENIQNAIVAFRRALEKDPRYALAHAGLGQAYWHRFEIGSDAQFVSKGAEECQQAAALNGGMSAGFVCLGTIYNGTGRYDDAARGFQRALTLEPANDEALRGLASAYEKLNKPAEAEKTYLRAINLRPEYWAGYNWLGAFYSDQSRLDDAARMFKRVVDLAPDSFMGYSNLGGVYLLQGRYQDAQAELERSVSIRPTAIAYSNLASAYFYLRRFADEARTLEQALRLDDSNYEVWGNLGVAYYWAPGARAKAAMPFNKAITMAQERLRVNPRDAGLLEAIAGYYAMVSNKEEALEYLERALKLASGDPALLLDASSIHNQFGDTDQALSWLQKALAAGISRSMVRDTPDFDNLRSDSRYQQIMRGR